MPRRNLHYLMFALLLSFICYLKADSVHRNHYQAMFETLQEAMAEIESRYLYEVDERTLFEGAMRGMVDELDQYSAYSGADATKKFREELDQEFGGIGIEVTWDAKTDALTVLSPIVGTPAYEKGIIAGDRITKIGDEPTENFTLDDAVHRLRGKPNEPVRLTLEREGLPSPIELEIRRAIINVDTVLGDVRLPDGGWNYTLAADPAIGYVRITQFGKKTTEELTKALEQCRRKNVRGLILDLRSNPGGLLDAAHEVCDLFVKSGVIVTIRDRAKNERERYEATGAAPYTDWPMVVLVNHFSASAAEIVSACLQDHGRAVVVGERTWGKGTVQTPIELESGRSMLRLTVASYWRPSGRNIHRAETDKETDPWGVTPDPGFEVKVDEKQMIELAKWRRSRDVLRRPGEAPPAPQPAASSATSADPSAASKPTATPSGPAAAPSTAPDKPTSPAAASPATPPSGESYTADPQLKRAVEYLRGRLNERSSKAA